MPLVTLRVARRDAPVTRQQKAELIAGISRVVCDVLDKRLESVTVLIDEVDPDNWGEGGLPVTEIRARRAAGGTPKP